MIEDKAEKRLDSTLLDVAPNRFTLLSNRWDPFYETDHQVAPPRRAHQQARRQILTLYDQLLPMTSTPVVALNRAVALAEVAGPTAALDAVDELDLGSYHLFHATRADLLQRLGRHREAAEAYGAALEFTSNPAERELLERRRHAALVR